MSGFISFYDSFKQIMGQIIHSPYLHPKWLNTLSYLENCGARKIAACEHPTQVKEEMLKHAAEEFRHAHYLKRQITRFSLAYFNDYTPSSLLGGAASLHYLNRLDLMTCRYLSQSMQLDKETVKKMAYLLVTYAIELRAGELYPIYDTLLRKSDSKVTVKSILLEEKEHLREMEGEISRLDLGFVHAGQVCRFEAALCLKWLRVIDKEVNCSSNNCQRKND